MQFICSTEGKAKSNRKMGYFKGMAQYREFATGWNIKEGGMEQKNAVLIIRTANEMIRWCGAVLTAAARRPAGARLHPCKYKTLAFLEINVRGRQHLIRLFFQEHFQAAQFERRIALLGRFGYVHSQRRASAARDDENANAISGSPLFLYNFLELSYCIVSQTYHSSSLM